MARPRLRVTHTRGVCRGDDGHLWVRVCYRDPKTHRERQMLRKLPKGTTVWEAAQIRAQIQTEVAAGPQPQAPQSLRLGEYAQQWYGANVHRWRRSTRAGYRHILESHVLPVFGDCLLTQIDRQDIIRWMAAQLHSGVSPVTVNSRWRCFRAVLHEAVADGLLSRAPQVRCLPEDPVEKPALALEELGRFLAVSREHYPQHHALFYLGFHTGARWGELCALTWGDIDEQQLLVTYSKSHYRGHVSGTKTRNIRQVPISQEILEDLREHRRMFKEQHPGAETDLVFPSRVGRHRHTSTVHKPLRRICRLAGIDKHVTPHTMRRTFNNLLRQSGVDQVAIRALTGHCTEAMTEHYSHVDLEERRQAVTGLSELMKKERVVSDGESAEIRRPGQ